MDKGYRLFQRFLGPEDAAKETRRIRRNQDIFRAVSSKGHLNLPFRVIDGEQVRDHLPDLLNLASQRLKPAAEKVAGERLRLLRDPKRAIRVQLYSGRGEGFRWHFDLSRFSALLTLANTAGAATQVITPGISRLVRPFYFAFYPIRQIFSVLRHDTVVPQPGDLMILAGGSALHRAVCSKGSGERLVVVASFESVNRRPSPLRDWIVRKMNY